MLLFSFIRTLPPNELPEVFVPSKPDYYSLVFFSSFVPKMDEIGMH
jgi:hypothetical protein